MNEVTKAQFSYLKDLIGVIDEKNTEQIKKIALDVINRIESSIGLNTNSLTVLSKKNYKAKDGTIKQGIEINGYFYAPKNDMQNKLIADVRRCIDMINDKNTFNDWLEQNTRRNSFLTWEYKGKIYNGLDELRQIWSDEIEMYYHQ